MSSYVKIIYDRIDFLEFKQNILFLKQPQHKASIFTELTLDDFIKIRNLAEEVETIVSSGEKYDFNTFEKELFKIWAPVRSFPYSTTLIAKALFKEDTFNALFQNFN